jgi:hypothetical protein
VGKACNNCRKAHIACDDTYGFDIFFPIKPQDLVLIVFLCALVMMVMV